VTEHAYVRAIRDLYMRLPHTSGRFSRSDYRLAVDLFRRSVPFHTVRSAMLLVIVNRLYRHGPSLPVIRSLHYFTPTVDEILQQPLPLGYAQYLEYKLQRFK
jgi:hypothetical protein